MKENDCSDFISGLTEDQIADLEANARRMREGNKPVTRKEGTDFSAQMTGALESFDRRAEERLDLLRSQLKASTEEVHLRVNGVQKDVRALREGLTTVAVIGGVVATVLFLSVVQLTEDMAKIKPSKRPPAKPAKAPPGIVD